MPVMQPADPNLLKISPFQDAHMHFMIEGRRATIDDYPRLTHDYLSHGILSVVDMGHKSGIGAEIKKVNHQGERNPLRIRSAGLALSKKGTYGGFLGKGLAGKREIKTAIKALARARADFIKVINSGIVSFRQKTLVTEGGFSMEEWKVLREEADRYGLPICCHANTDRSIQQAVTSGVSSIEHGFFISNETLLEMAEKRVSWTPTVFALLTLKPFLPAEEQRHLDHVVDNHLKAVSYGASIGVKLQVGTDGGSKGIRPGESFLKELQLFKKAGLSSGQVVSAACLGPEEIEQGNYLLVERNFIDQGRVEDVCLNGIRVTE